jgi:transposase InsO family protein
MGPEYPRKLFSVVVDRLTCFIWTKDYHGMPTSKDLINKIRSLQTKYDKKRIHDIHRDQGSQFRSKYWKTELERLQISPTTTSLYHP